MSKGVPSVQKFMTTAPHTIGAEQTLVHAHEMMRAYRIRHLPVLRGGKLVGIITHRDLALVEGLRDVDPNLVRVEDAMSPEAFTVSPEAPLDEVVSQLAAHKYGCAVVVQNSKVVGIFTLVDVCNAFAELLQGRLSK